MRQLDTSAPDFASQLQSLTAWEEARDDDLIDTVRDIIAAVRRDGDAAVLEFTRRFDALSADSMDALEVSPERLVAALEAITPQQREALETAAERIAAYEVLGREVVLYWRELKAEEKVEIPISLVAALPGTYTAPASRAYLYYTDEHKTWTEPLSATIQSKP